MRASDDDALSNEDVEWHDSEETGPHLLSLRQ